MFRVNPLRYRCVSVKQKLIDTTLLHVNKYGWNRRAITAACLDLGLSPASQSLITPYEMVSYAMDRWHAQAIHQINDTNFGQAKGITNKIRYAIRTRLELEAPYISTWHEAMALGAYPTNALQTKDKLWAYADDIWYRCGDQSTDYNYYTKRILFTSVYASTQLYMLTDKSPMFFGTWQFLDSRLKDVGELGKTARKLETLGSAMAQGIWSLSGVMRTMPNKVDNPMPHRQDRKE